MTPPNRGPGLRRTDWVDLAVPFAVIGLTVYVLLRSTYDSLPPLDYVIAAPLAALAVLEVLIARRVRAAVRHDPDAKMMEAIVIARCVALGKSSALVGAGVVGAGFGLLARTLPDAPDVSAAAHDSRVGVVLVVASALLVAAGLILERAGIDPGSRDGRRTPAGDSP